ncbi:phage head closure protein [Providencia rettgeri]|uniref:phage head closure protein n=1 Tax=Providencia TaxID=586 RepID=UPI001EE6B569|nr:phage head closure protein [Providencia rettgeri]MCG5277794.1 phage head closure protein [Providencia rettgeri]MCG9508725.1 phage head closure protein [Providencia rettgeri]
MQAGRLRHKVTFQRNELVKLPSGARKNKWIDIVTTRAEVKPISGRELLTSGAEMSEITVRVWMRFRPDINSTCRMLYNNLSYDIQSAIPDVKKTRLELLCKQGVKADG